MVDMSYLSTLHGSEASRRRLKRRRAAESRLKIYGILAIGLAALALVVLLGSVAYKAVGALTETYVVLPVDLPAADIDPAGSNDPKVIGKANFGGLTKKALKARFPAVRNRKAKKKLYDLVSGGAAFELRDLVVSDPALVGSTAEFRFLASDIVDLYVKGAYGRLRAQKHSGGLEITLDGTKAEITSDAPDFAGMYAAVKRQLLAEAARIEVLAVRQERGRAVFAERAAAASNDEDQSANATEAAKRATERDRLRATAEDLKERANSGDGREALTEDMPSLFVRLGGGWIRLTEVSDRAARGTVVLPIDVAGRVGADAWSFLVNDVPQRARKISDNQIVWVEALRAEGRVDRVFNRRFFTASDSREPELAGIRGAVAGTFWTMLVTIALAFPIGVGAAIYLEEFAPRNRLTDFIEVNINNLAAVPSIVFGLLGLAVLIGFFGVPRSAPLVGGMVLALMTLPTIIIASRAAIAAVPPSIRDAALALGASKLQASFHHVLPLSMPGILTGAIVGMAQALGETAPLIMIGMVAFIVDVPGGITDSATVLPVQIFRWSGFPERAFEAKTAAAICVLIAFLITMNAVAIFLRKRFERRW